MLYAVSSRVPDLVAAMHSNSAAKVGEGPTTTLTGGQAAVGLGALGDRGEVAVGPSSVTPSCGVTTPTWKS